MDGPKPKSTLYLLSKECPKSNLDTTFIIKKTAAITIFCKKKFCMTLHTGETNIFG